MPGPEAVARLRRVADLLSTLGPDGEWLADALERWREDEAVTLDEALGVTGRARHAYRLHQRDVLLREMRRRFYPALSVNAAADEISKAMLRYETSAWLSDRYREAMPAQYAGTLRELAFRVLQLGCRMPASSSQWRGILGSGRNQQVADEVGM